MRTKKFKHSITFTIQVKYNHWDKGGMTALTEAAGMLKRGEPSGARYSRSDIEKEDSYLLKLTSERL